MARTHHPNPANYRDRSIRQDQPYSLDRPTHGELERRFRSLRRRIEHRLGELNGISVETTALEQLRSRVLVLIADHEASWNDEGSFCDVGPFERQRKALELELMSAIPTNRRIVRRPFHFRSQRHHWHQDEDDLG